jgi:hypothetical protein
MNPPIHLKTITLPIFIPLVLACFALLPSVQAAPDPPALGGENTRDGQGSLASRTTGSQNTALGFNSLLNLTVGNGNTGVGLCTLVGNIGGSKNVATGAFALFNTNANFNVATGYSALDSDTTGGSNTGVGHQALFSNVTGSNNTAIGFRAGYNIRSGGNVCIGAGVLGLAGDINTTRIRNVYASVAGARIVYVNSDNKIGTLVSSRRYKEAIKPMDKASETLFALKPVTFRYKKEVDSARALSFGLIAEEVAKVSSDLITRDEDGNPQTVRYEAVNAMLLNEFLKEHKKVEELEATVAIQQEQIEALTAGLQKVSDQLEMSKPIPRVVLNNP